MKKRLLLQLTMVVFYQVSCLFMQHMQATSLTRIFDVLDSQLSGETRAVEWKTINGVCYVATAGSYSGINGEDLQLFKFEYDEYGLPRLTNVYRESTVLPTSRIRSIKWKQVGSDCLLAVAQDFPLGSNLELYRFIEDSYGNPGLEKLFTSPTAGVSGVLEMDLDWHTIDGTCYLAMGIQMFNANSPLRLFKLNSTYTSYELEELYLVPFTGFGRVNSVQWQEINGTHYLSVGMDSGLNRLRLFKYALNEYGQEVLEQVSAHDTDTLAVESQSWLFINGEYFLAVGFSNELFSTQNALQLWKFDIDSYGQERLVFISETVVSTTNNAISEVLDLEWQIIGGRPILLAAGQFNFDNESGGGDYIRLFELRTVMGVPTLVQIFSNSSFDDRMSSASWKIIDDVFYVAGGDGGSQTNGISSALSLFELDEIEDIVKSASNTTPQEGEFVTFKVTVFNNSHTADISGVSVTDVLPAGFTFVGSVATKGSYDSGSGVWGVGDLPANTNETLYITVTVDSGTVGTSISNTAFFDDPYTPYAITSDTATVDIVPDPRCDISIQTVANKTGIEVGEDITFTITATLTPVM